MLKNKKKGFTLVEIAVVIAIMAVLVAVLAPALLRNVEDSRVQKDESAMGEVCHAIKLALSDSEAFDEACAYAIRNNYVTYTDSSGVYGAKYTDEEFWAPDGSGYAVTITFNPDEDGTYTLSDGFVNDMTYGNGSVADSRVADELQQCYFSEMGNGKLYHKVKQTFGSTFSEKSATYNNSSYTVFITFDVVNGIKRADVYGEWNGTNLSPDCPASLGSGTSSYTEEKEPEQTKTGGVTQAQFNNSDLQGGGGTLGNTPNYKLNNQCIYTAQTTGATIAWSLVSNDSYCFTQSQDRWTSNNTNQHNTTATTTWEIVLEEPVSYTLNYFVSSESATYDYLLLTLNNTQIAKVGGTTYTEPLSKNINLVAGTNTLTAKYRKDGSVNKGQDLGYIMLPAVSNEVEFHTCSKHDESHEPNYILYENTATCVDSGIQKYKCSLCTLTKESPSGALGHNWSHTTLPTGETGRICNNCNLFEAHTCTNFVDGYCTECGAEKMYNFTFRIEEYKTKTGIDLSNETNIVVPATFRGTDGTLYKVTGVSLFENAIVKNVVLPEGITSIGKLAFYQCTALETINIPSTVTSIGGRAFDDCVKLKNVTFAQGSQLRKMGDIDTATGSIQGAFVSCDSLKEVDLRGCTQLTTFGTHNFYACSSLTTIYLPDCVTSLPKSTFMYCTALTSITIPRSVTSIENQAFFDCKNLTTIYYEGTVAQWNDITFGDNLSRSVPAANQVQCLDGIGCLTHIGGTATCRNIAECSVCGFEYGNLGNHTVHNGICTTCGAQRAIESEHSPYSNNINNVTLGTWDYTDAQSVTIEITYQTENTSCDWIYLKTGNKYIDLDGNVTSTATKIGGNSKTTKTFTTTALTGAVVFKTDGSASNYYGVSVIVTPNYDDSQDITPIEFSIKQIGTYQAEAGMTWGEWIESDYNTDGFTIVNYDENVYLGGGCMLATPTGDSLVYANDIIMADSTYNVAI